MQLANMADSLDNMSQMDQSQSNITAAEETPSTMSSENLKSEIEESNKKTQEQKKRAKKVFVPSGQKYYILLTGNTLKSHEEFILHLKKKLPKLQEVKTANECDFILVFCPVVSRAGTDIEMAMKKLHDTSDTKPAVLVVLHHTFDPECVVPESSRAITRESTITVDCLFKDDLGLLKCTRNDEAITHIEMHINPKGANMVDSLLNQSLINQSKSNKTAAEGRQSRVSSENITKQCEMEGIMEKPQAQKMSKTEVHVLSGEKYFILLTGKTLKSHEDFRVKLKNQIPRLQEVKTVDECDFILVFCPIVSRAGTDIEAAVKEINNISDTKPAVLVVLRHTFDAEYIAPESSRAVKRENTITVDCLFHEDQGLLTCKRNHEVFNQLEMQLKPKVQKRAWEVWNKTPANTNERRPSTQACEPSASPNNQKAPEFKHANEVIIAAELKLVLLGRTGSDMTAAKNIILGKGMAATSATTSTPETEKTQLAAGRKVNVVDTPDWFSPGTSLEEFRQTVGPQVFLLIIPVRNSEETEHNEDKTQVSFLKMEEIFGESCWRNTMIIFSVTDELQKKNIEQFIQLGDQELQELVKKCKNRFHCLNIKESGDGSQVSELLEKIEKMVDRNGNKVYQIIRDMVRETALLKHMQHQMQIILDKNKRYIKECEDDLRDPGQGQNSADHRKMNVLLKKKCELKIDAGEEIKKRYDRLVRMEENRQFIRVILPETMQTVWLSLPDEQNRNLDKKNELDELKEWFSTNVDKLPSNKAGTDERDDFYCHLENVLKYWDRDDLHEK